MNEEFNNPNQDPNEEAARAARLSRRQQAGRELGRKAIEPVAKLGGKLAQKGTEKTTEGSVRATAALGAGAIGLLAGGVGAPIAARGAWTASAPFAKLLGKGTGRGAQWATEKGIQKAGEKVGGTAARALPGKGGGSTDTGKDVADRIPGFIARQFAKPLTGPLFTLAFFGILLGVLFLAIIVVVVILYVTVLG